MYPGQWGRTREGRQEIADTFADFYEELFAARSEGLKVRPWEEDDGIAIPKITGQEVRGQLKKMTKGKAADSRGSLSKCYKKEAPT